MKKVLTLLFTLVLSFTFLNNPVKAETIDISINSKYAVVYNLNDQKIVYSKAMHDKMYPASLTKMMSVLCAMDEIEDYNAKVTISAKDLKGLAEEGASVAGFSVDEEVTYNDLLYGALLPSGADAINALSNNLFGSETKMVEAMNKKAKSLGLKETNFVNATGLHDDNHYSSAYDMLSILKYGLENEKFKEIASSKNYTTSDGSLTLTSTLLTHQLRSSKDSSFIVGGKTGFTLEGGQCLASFATKDDETYLCVSGFASGDIYSDNLINDTLTLYNYFYDNYEREVIVKKNKKIMSLDISKANDGTFDLLASEDLKVLLPKNYDKSLISYKFSGSEIVAPIKKGDKLGKIIISYNDEKVSEINAIASEDINKSFLNIIMDFVAATYIYFIIIIVVVIFGLRIHNIRKNKRKRYRR